MADQGGNDTAALEPANFIEIEEAPVPPGGDVWYLPTPDGARLRVACFSLPEGEPVRGTIVLLNGRCEIIEKYFEIIGELQARGFNVATMDWRGQGLSSRMLSMSEKGHIKSFGTYLADLKLFLKKVVYKRFEGPYLAFAHSMGSTPLLRLLAEGYDGFAGAVMSSPMTRLFPNPAARHTVRALAWNATRLGMGQRMIFGLPEHSMKFEGNNLTHDRGRHTMFRKLLETAPGAAVHAPTYAWVKAAMAALDEINAPGALSAMKIPVLMVQSEKDSTVDGTNAPRLARLYDTIETIIVPGAYHEVLMELDQYRDQFWQAFDRYVEERLAQAAGTGEAARLMPANDQSAVS